MIFKDVLVVEDNAKDLELTLNALGENNLANPIVVARDGAEALDYMFVRGKFATRPKGNPAVVILDMKLPKVDGLEVLKRIKADPNLKYTPVVMLTSSREEKDLMDSYQLGVNAYVVKPVGFSEFVMAVKSLGGFWAVVNEPPLENNKKEESSNL